MDTIIKMAEIYERHAAIYTVEDSCIGFCQIKSIAFTGHNVVIFVKYHTNYLQFFKLYLKKLRIPESYETLYFKIINDTETPYQLTNCRPQ